MKTWTGPLSLRRRAPFRRPERATPRPVRTATAPARAAEPATASAAADHLLSEVVAAAMLVGRGTAVRVVVCNAPASMDFDELLVIADRYGVSIEPIVRVGGGGLDLAVVSRAASDG